MQQGKLKTGRKEKKAISWEMKIQKPWTWLYVVDSIRSSRPEIFLRKCVLKISSKFTGEHPCRSVISIKLLYNFIKITLQHGYSPVNLLHIFRTLFLKNTSGRLLLLFSHNSYHLCSQVLESSLFFVGLNFIKEMWDYQGLDWFTYRQR